MQKCLPSFLIKIEKDLDFNLAQIFLNFYNYRGISLHQADKPILYIRLVPDVFRYLVGTNKEPYDRYIKDLEYIPITVKELYKYVPNI